MRLSRRARDRRSDAAELNLPAQVVQGSVNSQSTSAIGRLPTKDMSQSFVHQIAGATRMLATRPGQASALDLE